MADVNMGEFDAFSGQSGSAEYQHQGGYQEPGYHGVGIKNVKVHQPKRYNGSRNIIELGNWIFSVDRYLTLTKIGKTPFMALSFDEFPEMTLVKIDIAKMASSTSKARASSILIP